MNHKIIQDRTNSASKNRSKPLLPTLLSEAGVATVEWAGMGVVLVVLLAAVAAYVAGNGGTPIGSSVVDVMDSWVTSLEGGGAPAPNANVNALAAPDPAIPAALQPSTSLPSAVVNQTNVSNETSTAESEGPGFWGNVGGFFWGVGEGAVDLVVGVGNLAIDGVAAAPVTGHVWDWIHPESRDSRLEKYSVLWEGLTTDTWGTLGQMWGAMVEPITTDWSEGRYGEAIGRSVFEIGTLFVGWTKAGKVGKLGAIDAMTPDELIGALSRLDQLTPDEVAAVLARVDSLSPDEFAQLVQRLDQMTPEELARLGFNCSFIGDTVVSTPTGLLPINQLDFGSTIMGYDTTTGTVGQYAVLALWAHRDPYAAELVIDGELIMTTPDHPFFLADGRMTLAALLQPGDEVASVDGEAGTVESVEISESDEIFYNITVASAHTYFVGEGGWLVHNACKYTELAANLDRMTPDEFENVISGLKSRSPIRHKLIRDWLESLSPEEFSQLLDDIAAGTSNITAREVRNFRDRWIHKYGNPLVDAAGDSYQIHHGFPKAPTKGFREFFYERGIDIDHPDYMFELPRDLHSVVHGAGKTYPESWNGRWEQWIIDNPNATRDEIFQFRDELADEFGITEYLGKAPGH